MSIIAYENHVALNSQNVELTPASAFELAPIFDLRYREASASSHLNKLLFDHTYSSKAKTFASGLMLCAFNFQVARRVCIDLKVAPAMFFSQSWQRSLKPRLKPIQAYSLSWGVTPFSIASPLVKTRSYLMSLPAKLIDELIRIAPPVITTKDRKGSSRVIANQLIALLTYLTRGNTTIVTKELETRPGLERSLAEMCAAYVLLLEPIFEQRKQEIVRACGSLDFAQSLTGYSKSRCAQLLRGAR